LILEIVCFAFINRNHFFFKFHQFYYHRYKERQKPMISRRPSRASSTQTPTSLVLHWWINLSILYVPVTGMNASGW
jgi:hypothetical protein